jgi:murein DD-endopeptidase MepM/ murein hydrolase activator NlpD
MRTPIHLAVSGRHAFRMLLPLALLSSTACEIVGSKDKRDTSTLAPTPSAGAPSGDSSTMGGVPAAPSDSLPASVARDSGVVTIAPDNPTRGGVIFALAEGVATDIPRCSWKGATLPCYRTSRGVLAIMPLPADEPAGTFTLAFERPAGRITRQITVADRDFGRQLVFLDSSKFALLSRGSDISRDARTIRGILSGESERRRWNGAWRAPVNAGTGAGYGVERFYYRAADSSRAITVGPEMKTRGTFGLDTSQTGGSGVPSWRHAGVDLPASRRSIVTAPAAGVIADAGDYVLSGKTLLIDHGQGVYSAYFHLDTILVRRGDEVRAGKQVARVGSTGLATGPHLHYGIYVHGQDIDPVAWAAMPAFARDSTSGSAAPKR